MENSKGSSLKEAEEDKCSKIICYNCSTDGLLQNERPKSINYWMARHLYLHYIQKRKNNRRNQTKAKLFYLVTQKLIYTYIQFFTHLFLIHTRELRSELCKVLLFDFLPSICCG